MNRRKFFAGIAAAVTAACVPASHDYRHTLERAGYPFRGSITGRWSAKGPGLITERYSNHVWWCSNVGVRTLPTQDFAELEARTLASLQTAWKECITHRSKDL